MKRKEEGPHSRETLSCVFPVDVRAGMACCKLFSNDFSSGFSNTVNDDLNDAVADFFNGLAASAVLSLGVSCGLTTARSE